MFELLIVFHVIISLILIFIVLLQVGKGAEAGAAFGSMGQANTVRSQATFMGKFTTGLAITFMLTSLVLAFMSSENAKDSVVDKVTTEQVQQVEGDAAAPAADKAPQE